jgi:hypothetical protein
MRNGYQVKPFDSNVRAISKKYNRVKAGKNSNTQIGSFGTGISIGRRCGW